MIDHREADSAGEIAPHQQGNRYLYSFLSPRVTGELKIVNQHCAGGKKTPAMESGVGVHAGSAGNLPTDLIMKAILTATSGVAYRSLALKAGNRIPRKNRILRADLARSSR